MPTKAGLVLILLALGIGSSAYNTASNILFMTLALLLSCLLLSGLLSWTNFKGLRWRLITESHLRAGEPAPVCIELRNEKKWLPTYSLWFGLVARTNQFDVQLPLERRLDAGQITRLEWLLKPSVRCVETVSITQLRSQFPFGFLSKVIALDQGREVAVWPARIPYRFKPGQGPFSRREGVSHRRSGSGTELINLRQYRSGDPPRLIHWKASARQRRLLVREMAEEQRETYLVFVETPESLWRSKDQFETLCSFAAALAEDLFRQEQLWGVAVNGEPVRPVRRLADLHGFLDRLSGLEPVAGFQPSSHMNGATVIRFAPGAGKEVHAYVGGRTAGSA